jgi:hypothetical protein
MSKRLHRADTLPIRPLNSERGRTAIRRVNTLLGLYVPGVGDTLGTIR